MLRIYETDCAALAPYWDEALALLPPERRQRVQLCRDRAAALGIAAGGLLLRAVLGIRTDGRLLKGPCGKPHIPGGPEFNLSHGGTLAVLAVSDRAVGVDCEDARRGASEALLRRVLTPEEWEVSPAAIPFSRLWTRKEAVMKACGLGLGLAPASYCVWTISCRPKGRRGACTRWSCAAISSPARRRRRRRRSCSICRRRRCSRHDAKYALRNTAPQMQGICGAFCL